MPIIADKSAAARQQLRLTPSSCRVKLKAYMKTYRSNGQSAFRDYATAAAEEYAVAHELAQCAKVEVYHLLATELFQRVNAARAKTLTAFAQLKQFED